MNKKIVVDGVEYVPITERAEQYDGMEYVLVRTYSAGVYAGYLSKIEGTVGTLKKVRWLWEWDGALTLFNLAKNGTISPEKCKFPCEVSEITLTEIIAVIPMTAEAKESIDSVPAWEKNDN